MILGTATASFAADRLGNYVVRGVGIKSCVDYLEAEQTSAEAVQPYVWWIEGYVSSLNRLMPDTADSSPIRDLAIVAILTRNICRGDPSLRMETALGRLMRFFEPYRLTRLGPVITVDHPGGGTVEVYEETLVWVQQTLADQDLYDGAADGQYRDSLRQALASYQEQRGLPVNGLPDAQTLQALFREFPEGPEAPQ
ncbi:MAG: peptidoglycan-binding domain-containing protein [Alphaproteobacteria bacterium]